MPHISTLNYTAAKQALHQKELEVRCNVISPNGFQIEMPSPFPFVVNGKKVTFFVEPKGETGFKLFYTKNTLSEMVYETSVQQSGFDGEEEVNEILKDWADCGMKRYNDKEHFLQVCKDSGVNPVDAKEACDEADDKGWIVFDDYDRIRVVIGLTQMKKVTGWLSA